MYLWEHQREFPSLPNRKIVLAAIQAGIALENWRFAAARRHWRVVAKAAASAGYEAGLTGGSLRRILLEIDQAREVAETILFDGRLPLDLAARSSRAVAKMCARAVQHAMSGYSHGIKEAPRE